MAKANLQAALTTMAGKKISTQTPERSEAAPETPAQPCKAPSRSGKTNVTGYFPKEVKSSLRLVQARRGGSIQDLLAEALNDLFAKYNVPQTAPISESEE